MDDLKERKVKSLSAFPDWFWTAMITLSGVALIAIDYFVGVSFYDTYLKDFQIDGGAFPLEREGYLIYGVKALARFAFSAPDWGKTHWASLFVVLAFIVVAFGIYVVVDKYRFNYQKYYPRNGIVRPYRRKFVWIVVALIISASYLFATIPFLGLLLYMPALVGEATGNDYASDVKANFDVGCNVSPEYCFSLKKDNVEIARGFRVAQSKERVALYLNGVTYEYSLKDRDLQTIRKSP